MRSLTSLTIAYSPLILSSPSVPLSLSLCLGRMEHYIDIEFHTGALYTNMHMRCPITVYKKLPQVLPRILSLSPHGPHNPIQTAQLAHIPIGNPALPLPSAPPLPPGWNPTVAPLTAATAPSEPIKPVKQAPVQRNPRGRSPPRSRYETQFA